MREFLRGKRHHFPVVQAAGGVVYLCESALPLVLLVGSGEPIIWRLPKGIIEPGESPQEAALREVSEEAGVLAIILEELGVTSWVYEFSGTTYEKITTFFLMRFLGDSVYDKDSEYSLVKWIPIREATKALYYDSERQILIQAAERLLVECH
jgi:8-oxo-dGTP pyrophosphatase MutT (NUDIX family)